MAPSNERICLYFLTMLLTGVEIIPGISGQPKLLAALTVFVFVSSAWLFMDGLLSAMRPEQSKDDLPSDATAAASKP